MAKEEKIKDEKTVEENAKVETTEENKAENTEETPKEETKEKVKDPLEEANAQIEDLKDKYLRAVAEFENYKKRTLKEKAELILNGSEKTVSAILPILDDMERAISNADKAEDAKALEEGWELIFDKFKKMLESLGVKKIETELK